MGKLSSLIVLFFVASSALFEAGSAQDEFADWINPLLFPGYSNWLEESGSSYDKSPIPFILTNTPVTKDGEEIGSVNVLFNYTFTYALPTNTYALEETSLENRALSLVVYYMSTQLSGGYSIDGSIFCGNDTPIDVTGRGPFVRGGQGAFITEVRIIFEGFNITEDRHIDLSTAIQIKSFSGSALPPPWGDELFVMDLLKAGQCEEEVKMSIRRAAAREVSLSEFTVHPVPAYSKLQQYVQEMLNENPVPEFIHF